MNRIRLAVVFSLCCAAVFVSILTVRPALPVRTVAASAQPLAQGQPLPEIPVTSTLDIGLGTLREAFTRIEEFGGNQRIVFKLEKSDPNYDATTGTWRIKLKSPLVTTKSGVVVDGLSQFEYGGDTNPKGPEIVLDATEVTPRFVKLGSESVYVASVFFNYGGDKNWIRGFDFVLGRQSEFLAGIISRRVQGSTDPVTGTRITDNYIGLNPTGESIPDGGWYGISLEAGNQDTLIENNVICSPGFDIGIFGSDSEPVATNSTRITIRSNKIGTNASGTKRLAPAVFRNSFEGIPFPSIHILNQVYETVIENNILAGTRSCAIGPINQFKERCPTFTTIKNNRIGVGTNGENIAPDPSKDQSNYAIGVLATAGDVITGNTIANFGLGGIQMRDHVGTPIAQQVFTFISENQISNTQVGIQVGQIEGVQITKNTLSNCSRAGVAVTSKLLDAGQIFAVAIVPNPFGFSSLKVLISQNNFREIQGPAIGFMDSLQDLLNGTYQPNLALIPTSGPNSLRPSPMLSSAVYNAADKTIVVKGRVQGTGKLELFSSLRPANPTASEFDPNGYGYGVFLSSFDVKTGEFTATIPASKTDKVAWVTGTFTVDGETSEFSRTLDVLGAPDFIRPTVTVIEPVTGLKVDSASGARVNVVWVSKDNIGVVSHNLRLTGIRAGVPFVDTVATGLPGNIASFGLIVARNDAYIEGKITVEAADATGNVGTGTSGTFTVVAPPPAETEKPVVRVIAPMAGNSFESKKGTQALIVWTSSDNVGVVAHQIDLTNNAGKENIADGLAGTAQSFVWTIPENTAVTSAQITVSARDAAGNVGIGQSGIFTIVPPQKPDTEKPNVFDITASKTKVVRAKDPKVVISWKSNDNIGVVSHELAFARDGQNFNTPIVSGLSGQTTQFTWEAALSLPRTKVGAFLIVARDAAGNTGVAVGGGPLTVK
ncbi:MAG: right-handed parallel beta-helix repeat-containing protein [Blastocatellia bacterium]|nr:right-handed parallel beta-helix repeat-containing protein [Blastocatellia bacterium]